MNPDIKNNLLPGTSTKLFTESVKNNIGNLIVEANGPMPSAAVTSAIQTWVNNYVTIDFITKTVAGVLPASGLFEFDIDFAKNITPGLKYFYKFANAVNKTYGWNANSGLLTGQKYYLDPTIDSSKKSPNNIIIQNIKFSDIEFDAREMDKILLKQMQNQGFLKLIDSYETIFAADDSATYDNKFKLTCPPLDSSQPSQTLYYDTALTDTYKKYSFQSSNPKYKIMVITLTFPKTDARFVNKTKYDANREINYEITDIPDSVTQRN